MKISRKNLRGLIFETIKKQIKEDTVDNVIKQSQEKIGDHVSGGMSKKFESMSLRAALGEISKIHKKDIEDIMIEFDIGVKEEMEHTDSILIACEIALDHLVEAGDYYTRLEAAGL
ncbi:hypothetical protein KY315_01310 [Candidatus Woesearchaeota archaeon]|nr:hypothetical protein [Candidatus Woesearchaeota archaeon]